MSVSLAKEKLIEITGGCSGGSSASSEKISFVGVEYSSRDVKGGELFIALKGEKSHGHEYVEDAWNRGASLIMVEDPSFLDTFEDPSRIIVVDDSLRAFRKLASWWRRALAIPVLGITGSVGKTTVKEITASILLRSGSGTYSLKSHNNHVGVPYTLCRLKRGQKWAVVEMGMNHPGEIKNLTSIVEPDVATITRIAPAHVMSFGSLEDIAKAKLEILDGMTVRAPIILNNDDDILNNVYDNITRNHQREVRLFGTSKGSHARVSDIKAHGLEGISFKLELFGESAAVRMGAMGKHTAMNAACAALSAKTLVPSLTLQQVVEGLEMFRAPLMRLNLKQLTNKRQLIDDSYNANPVSLGAFIEFAGDLKAGAPQGVGLVVGDMLELGDSAEKYHQEIGAMLAKVEPAFIVAVGQWAKVLVQKSADKGIATFEAKSPEEAGEIVLSQEFDIVMLKASRGVGLERAVKVIMDKVGAPVP